jgi:hypothetical protein
MPRDHARVNLTIWTDPDFRALPPAAQHLYLTLWTAPELTYCGVHDWRPARLTGLSHGFTAEHIETVAQCLESRHFLVIDRSTEECLIRSWARFDGIMKQPRMAISFVHAYAATASPMIRQVLAYELCKIREESPNLSCWGDKRVAEVLEHPSISAKDLDPIEDPFGDDFAPGLDMGLPQTQGKVWGSVCTPSTPAPTPATNSEQNPSTDVDDEFDDFWSIYPRKEGKGAARKAWGKAVKSLPASELLPIVRSYSVRVHGTERRFIPFPATWLNQERWADEVSDQQAEANGDEGWFQPFTMPPAPPEVEDDPEAYEAWAEGRRAAWRAGERW